MSIVLAKKVWIMWEIFFGVGVIIMFLRLLLLTRVQLTRRAVPFFDVTSWCAPRSNQEVRQDVPSWNSLGIAALQSELGRKTYIFQMQLSPLYHHERQAWKAKVVAFL